MNYTLAKQIAQFVRENGGKVGIRLYDVSSTKNDIYGESKKKKYKPPVFVYGFVYLEPSDEMLTEVGTEKELTDIIVKIPKEEFKRVGLLTKDDKLLVNQDDLIEFNTTTYNISKIKPTTYLNSHLMYAIGGQKVK